ncbi:MAG: apolipoprotein N-acyltransferase [Fibrobacteres bacterium]|nr:apolipoprotein N-acyltransferase [Fibrobacterota bacterium]
MIALWALAWGLLQALCIPPLPLGPLFPLVLAGMLLWVDGDTPALAAKKGFLSGFVLQLAALHWIRNVMNVGPAATIAFGLILLFAYLAAFQALWAWLWVQCRKLGVPWAWPFLFTGIELVRGYGQMSFPWMHVGYDLGEFLPGLQGVAWTGVYGVGGIMAATAVVLALWRKGELPRRAWLVPACFWALWWIGGAVRWNSPAVPGKMRVAIVQPAIPQTRKWDENYFQTVMNRTWATADRIQENPDLWALPETAIPDLWSWRPDEVTKIQRLAARSNAPVVVGALEFLMDSNSRDGGHLRNSAFLVRPGKRGVRYDKLRLVPFSEHLPFDDFLPALNQVKLGQSGFSSGDTLPVWNTGIPWSPAICFEMVHADFPRLALANGARAMVVVTNDGWFGNSLGPRQHWNIHRFHAVENGLSMVRSANTGISGATDHYGRILAKTELMHDTALVVSVPEGPGSFYGVHGDWIDRILWVLSLAALGLLAFRWVRRRSIERVAGSPPP